MPKSVESLVSFSSGEWSQPLSGRVDQQKYKSACLQLRNMVALKTGPATRCPGTQYMGTGKYGSAYAMRVVKFQYSINTSFVLEFGHHYVRFYSNGAQVTLSSAATWISNQLYVPGNYVEDPGDSNNIYFCKNAVASTTQPHLDATNWTKQTIYEVPTPYDATIGSGEPWQTDIFGLQFCVINDVVYICHPNYPRAKLSRYSDTNWIYAVVQDIMPALLDQNATDTTIAASAINGLGTPGTVFSIKLTNPGTGYSMAPSVAFVGGGGSGAAATAVVGGAVTSVTVTNQGSGYTIPPSVSFSGGGGTGAAAYAVVYGGRLTAIVVTNGGTGYTSSPTVSFSYSPGTGAAATANISGTGLVGITLTNGGSGYTSAPTVQITGGGGANAAATAVLGGTINLTANAPPWSTAIYYDVGSSVATGGDIYECLIPHVSGTFATDLANGYWEKTPIFNALHVGSYWKLAYRTGASFIEYDATSASAGFANGYSTTIQCAGSATLFTYGVWSADVILQSSADNGQTWVNVQILSSRLDANFNLPISNTETLLYRIQVRNNVAPSSSAGATVPRIVLKVEDSLLSGLVQISSVIDSYHATASVITQLPGGNSWVSGSNYNAGDRVVYNGISYLALAAISNDTTAPPSDASNWVADGWPTVYWSEGAWSAYRGYPAAIAAFQQRVWFGFTYSQPQRVWATKLDELENFDIGDGTLATDGLAFDLDATGDGAILWIEAQDALFIGFSLAEWVMAAADGTSAISATNVTAHRQSSYGSAQNVPATVVGDALVFAQRQAVSLRQMLFSIVTNKYMSQDLTALSEQILNGGATQLAYQKLGQKNGFLWAVTQNGELAVMTYELDQEIFGWARRWTGLGIDFGFESVCTLQGKDTNDDEVWVVTNRTVNGSQVRYVERINPINWQNIVPQTGQTPGFGPDKNQAFYVDAGITITNPVSNVFTGLNHLIGRTVSVCINAMDYGLYTVANNGTVTVAGFSPGDFTGEIIVQIGLAYTSTVQPMNLDLDDRAGVTQGIRKKVTGVTVKLLNTLGCKMTDGIPQKQTAAPSLVAGQTYTILTIGTTDFTTVGAAANIVGLTFVASGPATGTGTCGSNYRVNELVFRRANDILSEPALFTGDKQVRDFGGDVGLSVPVILYTDGPLPLTVLGVALAYDLAGRP